MTYLDIMAGVRLWPQYFDPRAQRKLIAAILESIVQAPLYRPVMPGSGKPFTVLETNLGSLGWVSDARGYRYDAVHCKMHIPWPPIPAMLHALWSELTAYPAEPECCLVNLYRAGARMGLHQDRDEGALDAPVLSVSLGDDALFRIGGNTRKGPTRSVRLRSGDVLLFGGPARLAFHGIDRVIEGTSECVPGGGRINLTLRRVNAPNKKDARPGG